MSAPEQAVADAVAWSAQDWVMIIGAIGAALTGILQHVSGRRKQKKINALAEATSELEEQHPQVAGKFKRSAISKATSLGVPAVDWLQDEVKRAKTRRFDRKKI